MKLKFAFLIVLAFAFAPPPLAIAQGCSMCRDTTAGSAPQARKGLRIAIPLLGIPAAGIFLGVLLVAARVKPGQKPE